MQQLDELISRTETFFRQQAELYGREFYLDLPEREDAGTESFATLASFGEAIQNCQKCGLAKSRTHFVFGTGNPHANLLCIGEAPGQEEDRLGEPFVGAAGELLNRILKAIGFQREEVYIANIIKCRPPGNRDPEPEEISQCMPYLKQQIAMIQPRVILALGRVAAQNLLNSAESLGSLRGKLHYFEKIPVMVTYHPAALLRNPSWKRSTWDDVKELRKFYDQEVGDKPAINYKKS
ncbi:MAG: uracil-DNA glycosylase family protein [bacterium]